MSQKIFGFSVFIPQQMGFYLLFLSKSYLNPICWELNTTALLSKKQAQDIHSQIGMRAEPNAAISLYSNKQLLFYGGSQKCQIYIL